MPMKRKDNKKWNKNEAVLYGPPPIIDNRWRCKHCFHLNDEKFKICENCQTPKGSD